MAKLAIRGHATRGKEVIEILEMLGGKISRECEYEDGFYQHYAYFIDTDENSFIDGFLLEDKNSTNFSIFTLEQFLEKFPYKVGEKVLYYETPVFITEMEWIANSVAYHFNYKGNELMLPAKHLQPYKEETMEEIIKIDIPKGYEFAGVDDNKQQVVFEKIGCQYPKTYEECCKVLNISNNGDIVYSGNWVYGGDYLEKHIERIRNFQSLLICRDVYWKIAGDEYQLGKPWQPDFADTKEMYYIFYKGYIEKGNQRHPDNHILIFPTPEMRDAFYENFKELIKLCKELL